MEEYQGGGEQNKGFDYSSVQGLTQLGSIGGGSSFADPNNQSSANTHHLANFNQYANYSISPQQQQPHHQQQQQQTQTGYTYDPTAVYNTSPQMLYTPQSTINTGSVNWNTQSPLHSPQWLVNGQAQSSTNTIPSLVHAGTSSAVDSSRWTSNYTVPGTGPTNLVTQPYGVVPPMGSQSWDGEGPNSLSSSARLKPFIEKLFNILAQPASFRDCLVWDESGTAFIVSHANPRLLQQVLPDAFGHSNLHSFTRQLNIYGFTRCTSAELLSKLDVT